MRRVLETKGYKFLSSFDCRGQMLLLNRGNPPQEDLVNVKSFAGNLTKLSNE